MTPRLRQFSLTAHVAASVGWFGAAVAYLALAIAALASQDDQMVRAAYLGLEPIAWFALVPLSLASLLTGIVMSLGTTWGLFRHYWVLFKLLLTVVATLVLLMNMSTVSFLAGMAVETDSVSRDRLWGQILHSGVGLLVLLVVTGLGVYKPRGMTNYGQRKSPEHVQTASTPQWAKVFGVIVVVLILLVGIMMLGGEHGPGVHLPPGG